jgi:hypothetical protein
MANTERHGKKEIVIESGKRSEVKNKSTVSNKCGIGSTFGGENRSLKKFHIIIVSRGLLHCPYKPLVRHCRN